MIKDQQTGEPVENVFIFLENTSIGTITDLEGKATITHSEKQFTLVFTHIIYETVSIEGERLQNGLNTFFLKEKNLTLNEITVKSKKISPKKRKKWMKRFQEAFLGKKISRKKVTLLNPEVIWFEESQDTLYAYAIDNLKIRNKETAYEMQFALEKFAINTDDDLLYSGRLFFKDIKDTFKRKRRIEKSREDTYLASKQLFFRSLILRHPVNPEKFEFGKMGSNTNGENEYQRLEYDDLNWSHGPLADTLFLDDYLAVFINDGNPISLNAGGGTGRRKLNFRRQVSFLKSRSGKFVISRDGALLNDKEVEESGYWATFRMAKELPLNYDGSILFQNLSDIEIVDHLLEYQYEFDPEKVYLHTDKVYYLPYSTCWFKGYIVDAIHHTPSRQSQVLYVDLINPEDKIIKTWILHKDLGLKGEYQWSQRDTPGEYRLRAYTNYMRNVDDRYLFEKSIWLQELTPRREVMNMDLADTLRIQFYPEGGDLIQGLNGNVVFQAINQDGRAVEVTGHIIDDQGAELIDVQTIHEGFGEFAWNPDPGKTYFLRVEGFPGNTRFELPPALSAGLAMTVNAHEAENIYVSIASSHTSIIRDAFLVGHVRGQVFRVITGLQQNQNLKFSKSELPTGVIHFTLFDGQERPQAERLVFNDYGYDENYVRATLNKSGTKHDRSFDLKLLLDSMIMEETVDLSASVTCNNLPAYNEQNIRNYLLCDSDLAQNIPNKEYYLRDITNVKRYHLDLLMQRLFWSRFNWRNLKEISDKEFNYPAEIGYSISGYTSEKDKPDGVQSQVLLTSLGPEIIYDKILSGKDGKFAFNHIPLLDSTTYLIQARKQNKLIEGDEDVTALTGDRLIDIHIDDFSPIGISKEREALYRIENQRNISDEDYFEIREDYLQKMERDSGIWMLDAPDVTVTARRPFTSNRPIQGKLINMDNVDWVEPNARGKALLSTLAPLGVFESGPDPSKLYSVFYTRLGERIKVPVQIIIDGMGADPTGSNVGPFLGLTADRIESIYIGKTFIDIQTTNIPRSLKKSLESGILYVEHPGYYRAREFSPEYPSENILPFETTISWHPEIQPDEAGQTTLNFMIPNTISTIHINIEGISESGRIIQLDEIMSVDQE